MSKKSDLFPEKLAQIKEICEILCHVLFRITYVNLNIHIQKSLGGVAPFNQNKVFHAHFNVHKPPTSFKKSKI